MGFITPKNKAGYFLGGVGMGGVGPLDSHYRHFSLFSLGDLGEPDSIPWDSNHHFSLTTHLEIFLSFFFQPRCPYANLRHSLEEIPRKCQIKIQKTHLVNTP